MQNKRLLPLTLLMLGISSASYAEHVSLPALSVEGMAGEATPFALPGLTASTTDTGNMVKRLPGANVNRNGVITSIPQYRGLFGRRVNVMVDGVNPHEAGPNSMDSPLINLAASRTENISVYRGIAPVRTGIETIGGTIEGQSKGVEFGTGSDAEIHGNANAGYASNGQTRQLGLTAAITNQHHRLQVSGSSDRGDDQSFDGGTIRSSEQDRDTVGVSYGYQNNGLTFDIGVEHLDAGVNGTPALPMDILFFRGETTHLKHGNTLANGDSYKIHLHHQDVDHAMDNFSYRENLVGSRHRLAIADLQASGLNAQYQHQNWLFGVNFDEAEHNTTIYNPNMSAFFIENFNGVERDRYSIFAEWNGDIAQSWNLETGIRYSRVEMDSDGASVFSGAPAGLQALAANFSAEDLSQDDNLVDIFATFTHKLSEQTDVEIGFARKTRAPSYQERYLWAPLQSTGGLADGRQYVGDINLDEEVAYQFELGLDWHTNKVAFSPRVFYHHINDYIQGVEGQATAQQQMVANGIATMLGNTPTTLLKFSNVDAKLYGLDANWLVSLSSEWQLDGTVSYVRGERRDTSDDLYRIAPLTARTTLSYIQPTWQLGFEAETVARQTKVSEENAESKSSGYALFNLTGQYQAAENVIVAAGVNNIFDRYYQDHLGGINRAAGNPDISRGEKLPGAGRSAYINVNVNF